MYSIKIPAQQVANLWRLREYAGCGPIAAQVRRAIETYINSQKEEILQIEKILEQEQGTEINR